MNKNEQISIFCLTNVSFSNLNTIHLKLSHNLVGIYRFEKKFKKYSEEINPLGVHTFFSVTKNNF